VSTRIAADIGGTFTDIIVYDESAGYKAGKVPTVVEDPSRGVLNGLGGMIGDFEGVEFAVHGTTVGLNAFLQRKGARVLLLVSAGTRDVYHIARGNRFSQYEVRYRKPQPLVSLGDIVEVRGRLSYSGEEIEPLREDDVRRAVERVEEGGYEAIAVTLLFSYLNPAHEVRVEEILREALPDVPVSCSHQVAREWREYERTSSAVFDAYTAPAVRTYLTELEGEVARRGMRGTLHVMQSNGGILTARGAREHAIQTLLSGPVGGVMGGTALSEHMGRPNLICADMGGTSFDVSLIVDGHPDVSSELSLEGLPLLMPAVMIHTIGAGGGSLGFVEGGGLRVGPASAGADPGPACYGRGGSQATVTDANLVLGRLDPEYFLGGEMDLDVEAARRAVGDLGKQLGLDPAVMAEGMITVINAKMAQAIRTLTVEKGISPNDFSLLAYGGAGPLHATFLAEELGISEVIVPESPGAFSAWGMLQAPIRHDLSQMFYQSADGLDGHEMERLYAELESEGRELLAREGVRSEAMSFRRSVDVRYSGQEHTVDVPLRGMRLGSPDVAEELGARFHQAHYALHGHSNEGAPFECVVLRVVALGNLGMPETTRNGAHEAPRGPQGSSSRRRGVVFGGRTIDTPVVYRADLRPGASMSGPVVVEERTASTVVPPGFTLVVDPHGSLILTSSRR